MQDYRKFWLINSQGTRYDFTDANATVFLNDPEGLGFQRKYSSVRVGNSELVTSTEFVMTDIEGELLFFDSINGVKYQQYQNFIQFAKFKPLEFHYETPNNIDSYHCEVLFVEAEKGEVDEDGMLHVPVVFHRLTEWLTDTTKVYVLSNETLGMGKFHNDEGDSPYMLYYNDPESTGDPSVSYYSYQGNQLDDFTLHNNGTSDVGFLIQVDGEIQNFAFNLSQNGEIYGKCKINGTYDLIRINSVDRSESIYMEDNGSAVTNPEQYQDFTIGDGNAYLTWCKFKVGETHITISAGNLETFSGTITISYNDSYVTV